MMFMTVLVLLMLPEFGVKFLSLAFRKIKQIEMAQPLRPVCVHIIWYVCILHVNAFV